MRKLAVACVLTLVIPTISLAGIETPISIIASEDAMVDNANTSANYADGDLRVQVNDPSDFASYESVQRSYLKFNLNELALPEGSTITSVLFKIYLKNFNTEGTGFGIPQVALYAVSNDTWQEGAINWDNKPVYGDMIGSAQNANTIGLMQWDLSSLDLSSDLADGSLSLMIRLINDEEISTQNAVFISREAQANQPMISLTYVPEPASMVLLALGGLTLLRKR
jgi:hypothetical protein